MSVRKKLRIAAMLVAPLVASLVSVGCDTAEDVADLQDALDTFVQNKSLAEQFVRDIKTSIDPADPAYQRVMESYFDARDSYNHLLDVAETAAKTNHSHVDLSKPAGEAQDRTAQFLQDATRALKPSINTREIPFERAMVIPTSLPGDLRRLSPKTRERAIQKFDHQARWRSWREF